MHRTGGCWYRASTVVHVESIVEGAADAMCKECFKKQPEVPGAQQEGDDLSDRSVSTDDESSTSDEA